MPLIFLKTILQLLFLEVLWFIHNLSSHACWHRVSLIHLFIDRERAENREPLLLPSILHQSSLSSVFDWLRLRDSRRRSGVRSQETGRSSHRSRIATGLIWFLCLSDSLQPRSRFPFMFLKSENQTKCCKISLLTSEFETNCLTERCLSNDLLLRLICCSRIFSDHNRWSQFKLSCHGIIVYFCYSPIAFMLPKWLKNLKPFEINSKHLKHASNNSNKVQYIVHVNFEPPLILSGHWISVNVLESVQSDTL